METLAFIHAAIEYEDPSSSELRSLSELKPLSTALGVATVCISVGATSDRAMAMSTVGYGSSGSEVQAVQQALGIQADGQFGPKTEAALTDFQVRQNLKQVDGVVGQETAAALGLSENYKPTGVVSTRSGIGVNIRSGPGLDYRRIGGASDGTSLDETSENVVYRGGYAWSQIEGGGWVASEYLYEGQPVSYDPYPEPEYQDVNVYNGRVDTYSNIGLNVRSGPGLSYGVVDGYGEGAYVSTGGGTVYRDGYAWQQTADGWVASNYVR
ncbi:MAG TPA: SH3 domain-containing protein [Thermosynechococcaceae cyanobacterium]